MAEGGEGRHGPSGDREGGARSGALHRGIAGSRPDGRGFDSATGVVSSGPAAAGIVALTFEVTNKLGATAGGGVSLTIK
jgi:hypothetical protein